MAASIKLFIVNGPNRGKSYDVEKDNIYLGRTRDNDIQIVEKSISRRHLRIRKDKGKYFVTDLNSTNGTFVDGKLIRPDEEFEVKVGTPIAVGKIMLSLGEIAGLNHYTIQDMDDFTGEFSSTAMFTAYKDRPSTLPKNMELIFNVSKILMQSMDINKILQNILDSIFDLLKRIDRGYIILTDPKTREIKMVIPRLEIDEDDTKPLYSRSIVNRVIKEGDPIILLDTFGQEEHAFTESMEIMNVRSVMCVPLISKSQIWGVIYVDSLNRPYGFREADLDLLTALSGPAAVAIENALLYHDMEKLIKKRTENLEETEGRLKDSEKRFKVLFQNIHSGIAIFEAKDEGKDYILLDINKTALKMDDFTKKDIIGKSIKEVIPEIESTELFDIFDKVYKTGKPENLVVKFENMDSVDLWREYSVYKLPSGEVVSLIDDITDRKRSETEQKILQEQLLISQKMESVGAFAGGTAHNFRNILQAISGNIEYLEMIHSEDKEIKELAHSVYGSVEKGVDLINNLLHFSRRGGDLKLSTVDISDVVRDVYEIINKVIDKNIDIHLDLEDALYVKGNQSLLGQSFMNLFTNARDAMPDGGILKVKTRKVGDEVVAVVSDTGHGIEKRYEKQIFDPFFTLKEVGKGTGLGLPTTHGIIKQHNGSITFSTQVGKGTSFKISLPYFKTSIRPRIKPKPKIIYGNGQKILIVDDESQVLQAIGDLVKNLGYEPVMIDKPAEAVKRYREFSPAMVLMDRSMPGMDGIECSKSIKEIDPDSRIVIISGYDESGPDGINDEARKLINGYLTKPCGARELSKMISSVLEGS